MKPSSLQYLKYEDTISPVSKMWSHHLCSIWNLKPLSLQYLKCEATISPVSEIWSHHLCIIWNMKPPSLQYLKYEAIISAVSEIWSHHLCSIWNVKPSSLLYLKCEATISAVSKMWSHHLCRSEDMEPGHPLDLVEINSKLWCFHLVHGMWNLHCLMMNSWMLSTRYICSCDSFVDIFRWWEKITHLGSLYVELCFLWTIDSWMICQS